MNDLTQHSRRTFLMKMAILLNGIVGVVLAVPVFGYLLGPLLKKDSSYNYWVSARISRPVPRGRNAISQLPQSRGVAWDGQTGTIPCWVRRVATGQIPGIRY